MVAGEGVNRAHNFIDLTGNVYNRLTVVSFKGRIKRHSYWNCICECGNKSVVDAYELKKGRSKSCGCYIKEARKGFIPPINNRKIHGLCNHKLYAVHRSMIARCNNKNNKSYSRYGGRGIKVCDRWLNFIDFYNDMNPTYQEGLTLERIDYNGDYCLENCKWETYLGQARNTRSNKIVTYNGITAPVSVICEKLEIDPKIVYRRMRDGWTVEDSFSTPIMKEKINFSKRVSAGAARS